MRELQNALGQPTGEEDAEPLDDAFLVEFLRTCAPQLGILLSDTQPDVVREACACVIALTARGALNRGRFPAVAEAFAPALLRLVSTPSYLADHGNLAARVVFSACHSPALVTLLAEELETSKNATGRGKMVHYVTRLLGEWPAALLQHCRDDAQRAMMAGFRDEDMDVRLASRACFHVFEAVWPAHAARLLATLGPREQQLILHARCDNPAQDFGDSGCGKVWETGGRGAGWGNGSDALDMPRRSHGRISETRDSTVGFEGELGDRLASRGARVRPESRGGARSGSGGSDDDDRVGRRKVSHEKFENLAPLTPAADASPGGSTFPTSPLPLYEPFSTPQQQRRFSMSTGRVHHLSPLAMVRKDSIPTEKIEETVAEEAAIVHSLEKLNRRMAHIRDRRRSLRERPLDLPLPSPLSPPEQAAECDTNVSPPSEMPSLERKSALARIKAEWGGDGWDEDEGGDKGAGAFRGPRSSFSGKMPLAPIVSQPAALAGA